jgi:hypothetical protein
MPDQPAQSHPMTLEINGIIFEGDGVLKQEERKDANDVSYGRNIRFSYEQLGVLTETEARAKIRAQQTGIFEGTRDLLSGGTEFIRVEVKVRQTHTDQSRGIHIAVIELISPPLMG